MLPTPNHNPIAVIRTKRGLTQTEVARLTRLSLGTVRNAERGLHTRTTLAKLARVLSVTVDELTGRKESTP